MKNTTCGTARFSRPWNVSALLASPDLLVMAHGAKARFLNCGLDSVSGSGKNLAAFGDVRSRRGRAWFAATAMRANWLWGRCWSNGCLGEGARTNSEVKETGMGNRRKFGAVQGRSFCPRALGGAGSCPCLCIARGFQKGRSIALLSNSAAARNLRTGLLDSGMDERQPASNLLRATALQRRAIALLLLPSRSQRLGYRTRLFHRQHPVAPSDFRQKTNH